MPLGGPQAAVATSAAAPATAEHDERRAPATRPSPVTIR